MTATAAVRSPAEPLGVAALIRTSTLDLQDPVASYRRQLRSITAWLPEGWYIAAVYADVESGGIGLEQRGQTDSWQVLAAAGLQRDGGITDLMEEAASPAPRFGAAACEDIERSARDTFTALRIERHLADNGIPLFATDEPADIEGVNPTMILVRRVKQGVAEWFRLQLKGKTWKGLQEHSLDGWNIGTAPYGYAAERHPHPAPAKAAQGRTKTRLAEDPATAPWVTKIFRWRVLDKMALSAIARRLDTEGAPSPHGRPWSIHTVYAILSNPKYTGYMVFGRRRAEGPAGQARKVKVPMDQWLWSPEPTHPALVSMDTWKQAQDIGSNDQRGRVRDRNTPAVRDAGTPLRGRIRCNQCQRRLSPSSATYKGSKRIYYVCPHNPNDPAQAQKYPGHVRASLKDTAVTQVLAQVLAQRVFGPDRAAMLAAQLPATQAEKQADRDAQAAALRKKLAKIETSMNALMTELEELGASHTDDTRDYRQRIRTRHAERRAEKADTETRLAALETQTLTADDPRLLDAIPRAAARFATARPAIREALYNALDIQILYREDKNQMTIWITITDSTPDALQALLDDPRTDTGTAAPSDSRAGTGTEASTATSAGQTTAATTQDLRNLFEPRMACSNAHSGRRGRGGRRAYGDAGVRAGGDAGACGRRPETGQAGRCVLRAGRGGGVMAELDSVAGLQREAKCLT